MAEIRMPHPAHEEHLCLLGNIGTNLKDLKKLVKNPKLQAGRTFVPPKNYDVKGILFFLINI